MELQHFSHEHSLVFIQEQSIASEEEEACCFGCGKVVDGPSYCCNECKFYLHKNCAELELAPQINHPFHPKHLLTLLPKSPYRGEYMCNCCGRSFLGFVYHCAHCQFDLDVNCALHQSFLAENFPKFLHEHPLIVVQNHNEEVECDCAGCAKPLSGPIYHCLDCPHFYLHKECAELPLEINHPFHPKHLLTLLPEPTKHSGAYGCDFCHRVFSGFYYHCAPCKFYLDVNCALLQSSIAENLPNCLRKHPLIFVQNHNEEVECDCAGCAKPLSGPIYYCLDCPHSSLHKECAELPREINHPYDRIHPLTLLPSPPIHPENCCCYLCKIEWKGFVYCCSLCKFELTPEDVFAPRTITAASHEHPWTLLSSQISFICDFCGTAGDRTPYFCTTCDLLVHKNCISLPHNIMITRHHHVISHSHSLQSNQFENWECRICHDEVNTRYGSYYCSTSNCNYIAHVNCATDKEIWDGTIILEDEDKDKDERSKEAQHDSLNLITNVFEEISCGDDMVAIEIKHAYHAHNLILTFSGEIKDDNNCDGCMRPLSTPFYSCDQCKFFLHKNCAELPRKKGHPFHKHLLTLTDMECKFCDACRCDYGGFSYICSKEYCFFKIDIQCSLFSDTLKHPSHEHPLYLVNNYRGQCSGCLRKIDGLAYRCMKRCDFTVDLQCMKLPPTAWYKYDRHPLTLTYFDDSNPCQLYCDLCENERHPNHWFYYCAECDNSLHSNCAIGDFPFIRLGTEIRTLLHPHPLIFVKNIWNCPRCKVCGKLCNGQTLECKESECNLSIHRTCMWPMRAN